MTNEQKELVIAQALSTDEGRTALAQAMVEPIRRSLEYQAVGRKLLLVDESSSTWFAGTFKKFGSYRGNLSHIIV